MWRWGSVISSARAQEVPSDGLARGLQPLLKFVSGQEKQFGIAGTIQVTVDRTMVPIELRSVRFDDTAFDLDVDSSQYSVRIRRRQDATAFALPHHTVVFLGQGKTDDADHLAPEGVLGRLISPASLAAAYCPLMSKTRMPPLRPRSLTPLLKVKFDSTTNRWAVGKNASFKFGDSNSLLEVSAPGANVTLNRIPAGSPAAADDWSGFNVVTIERAELERQLTRGIRRATEVLAPGSILTSPSQEGKKVENGELRWIDGHRIVLLNGTPEQIGLAHGKLLREEALRCVDSVLYSFGTAQTILTGRWFRHDLERAYARLSPHIPEDHKRETRALARSLQMDPKLAEALNVFPEMFHCSGFAVFGKRDTRGQALSR